MGVNGWGEMLPRARQGGERFLSSGFMPEEHDPHSQLSLADVFLIGCSSKIHPSLTPCLIPQRQRGAICLHLHFMRPWVLLPSHLDTARTQRSNQRTMALNELKGAGS